MALPSARRPAIAEEELQQFQEELIEKEESKWKIKKLNTYAIFQDMMGTWYANLGKKDKARLTLKKLKRAVLSKLYEIKVDYDKLPKDWLQTLLDMHNIQIYEKTKKSSKSEDDIICPEGQVISVKVDPLTRRIGVKSKLQRDNEDDGGDEVDGIKKRKTEDSDDNQEEKTTIDIPKKPCKKVIDLSNEPPPAFWLKAYAEGVHLPRMLTISSSDDVNVIFYDYSPKVKSALPNQDLKYKQRVHEANGFNWFRQ